MAPPAKGVRTAGGVVVPEYRDDRPGASLPSYDPSRWSLDGVATLTESIVADALPLGRGARIVVSGPAAEAAAGHLAQDLSRHWRCLVLDATSPDGQAGPGLIDVLDGHIPLAQAISPRGGRLSLLGSGAGDPDRLVLRPHPLAVVLDALSFAYDAVIMSTRSPDEAMLGEVLAAISDCAILAPWRLAGDPRDLGPFQRRGVRRIGALDAAGAGCWLAGSSGIRYH
ncbi:MAG: hypothetical protein U1E62_26290 [Alsobacter sp.]